MRVSPLSSLTAKRSVKVPPTSIPILQDIAADASGPRKRGQRKRRSCRRQRAHGNLDAVYAGAFPHVGLAPGVQHVHVALPGFLLGPAALVRAARRRAARSSVSVTRITRRPVSFATSAWSPSASPRPAASAGCIAIAACPTWARDLRHVREAVVQAPRRRRRQQSQPPRRGPGIGKWQRARADGRRPRRSPRRSRSVRWALGKSDRETGSPARRAGAAALARRTRGNPSRGLRACNSVARISESLSCNSGSVKPMARARRRNIS